MTDGDGDDVTEHPTAEQRSEPSPPATPVDRFMRGLDMWVVLIYSVSLAATFLAAGDLVFGWFR